MTIILALLFIWYVTKVYYTKTFHIQLDSLEKHGLIEQKCSKCSKTVVTDAAYARTPFYCLSCV